MNLGSLLFPLATVGLLVSCSIESKIQDKVWESTKQNLISPATAKFVSCETRELSGDDKLAAFKQTYPSTQIAEQLIKSYQTESGRIDTRISQVVENGEINYSKKRIVEGIDLYEELCAIQKVKDKESQKNRLFQLCDKLKNERMNYFRENSNYIKIFKCHLVYDAQNAFGALLRKESYLIVSTQTNIPEYVGIIDSQN